MLQLGLKRRARLMIFAAALLAAPAQASITPQAQAVIDRYLEAIGSGPGAEATQSTRVAGHITALGLTGTTTTWTQRPDRRATETHLGPFVIREGFDGKVAWRTDPGSGKAARLDGKDLEDARASGYFDNELWLDPGQGGGAVTFVGAERDSNGRYDVLEVAPPVGRARRFYFNQTTHLIDRATTKKDQLDVVSTLSDYRLAGGRRIPFRQLTQILGMPANDLVFNVDSVWVNEPIPDQRFSIPDDSSQSVRYLKQPGTARLPFRYAGRHLWLQASVNGLPPADFLFDTGASITVIDSAYAAKIGLATQGHLQGQGAGATGGASLARLQSVRVTGPDGDGVEIAEPRVAVLSINPFLEPFFWKGCAGVLGYDFISRFVDEIDYDDQTLTLHDPKTFQYSGAGTRLPFTLAGTVPAIHMKIDGDYEGDFRLDVGSGSTVDLHGPFVKRAGIAPVPGSSIEVMGGGFGGTFTNQLVRMKKIEIGPYSWERPLVSLSGAETGALASEDYAGNIGNQILERFKCTLDYERRVIYLEPGKHYSEPDRFSRAGVMLARYGDTVRAMQVLPGSPAAKAGLKENDSVISIDGRPVLAYTPDDLTDLFDHGEIGRQVTFEVDRGGKPKKLSFKLREII